MDGTPNTMALHKRWPDEYVCGKTTKSTTFEKWLTVYARAGLWRKLFVSYFISLCLSDSPPNAADTICIYVFGTGHMLHVLGLTSNANK